LEVLRIAGAAAHSLPVARPGDVADDLAGGSAHGLPAQVLAGDRPGDLLFVPDRAGYLADLVIDVNAPADVSAAVIGGPGASRRFREISAAFAVPYPP